jgi:hypothetical protein
MFFWKRLGNCLRELSNNESMNVDSVIKTIYHFLVGTNKGIKIIIDGLKIIGGLS